MMEIASASETSVNFYQTTQRYNPEDSHLRIHRREYLKSYLGLVSLLVLQPSLVYATCDPRLQLVSFLKL
jgi:hypothetical protein